MAFRFQGEYRTYWYLCKDPGEIASYGIFSCVNWTLEQVYPQNFTMLKLNNLTRFPQEDIC